MYLNKNKPIHVKTLEHMFIFKKVLTYITFHLGWVGLAMPKQSFKIKDPQKPNCKN